MIKPHRSTSSSGLKIAAILVAVVALLYVARQILIPLAFAIIFALVLTPAVVWLQKLHLPKVPAVVLVMLVAIAAAGGIGYVIVNQLIEVVNELPRYQENIQDKIQAMRAPMKGALGRAAESVKEVGKQLSQEAAPTSPPPPPSNRGKRRETSNQPARPLPVEVVEPPANILQSVRDLTTPVLTPLLQIGVVLIFTIFLLIEESDLRNRLFRLAGLNRLNMMTLALDDATHRVSRYLMLQILVNAGFGLICGIGLYLIGVPYAVLWGAVAALLRLVPYIGSVVAGLLPFTLSLAVFDHWMPPLLVFLLFATLEILTGNFFEPWLYGAHTGISALALLLTTVFWAALWGPAGLILSTPLTVCVVVLGRHLPQLSFLHILLGDEPALVTEAHLYQRLLAMDDLEARSVAAQYMAEHSLIELYDLVIIPALTMAEHDRHKGTLDPSREEFLYLTIKEILGELAEKAPRSELVKRDSAVEPAAKPVEITSNGRALCVPASDEADEIAAAMLAQLLGQAGHVALSFPVDGAVVNTVELVQPGGTDVFCISAVPPFAFARASVLSRQLRRRFPDTKVIAGVWGFSGDPERALQRFQAPYPDKLATSLTDAVAFVIGSRNVTSQAAYESTAVPSAVLSRASDKSDRAL